MVVPRGFTTSASCKVSQTDAFYPRRQGFLCSNEDGLSALQGEASPQTAMDREGVKACRELSRSSQRIFSISSQFRESIHPLTPLDSDSGTKHKQVTE